ncbi:hypothetical protein Hanom_Chr01g00044721 [Helianthus anomalus]
MRLRDGQSKVRAILSCESTNPCLHGHAIRIYKSVYTCKIKIVKSCNLYRTSKEKPILKFLPLNLMVGSSNMQSSA